MRTTEPTQPTALQAALVKTGKVIPMVSLSTGATHYMTPAEAAEVNSGEYVAVRLKRNAPTAATVRAKQ